MSTFLTDYRAHAAERAALGIPPLPLDAKQVAALIELIKAPPAGEDAFLMDLLTHRVPPGVDDAAKVKASFLAAVAHGELSVGLVSKAKATELLGTMVGGYNVHPLIELLDDAAVASIAAEGLNVQEGADYMARLAREAGFADEDAAGRVRHVGADAFGGHDDRVPVARFGAAD